MKIKKLVRKNCSICLLTGLLTPLSSNALFSHEAPEEGHVSILSIDGGGIRGIIPGVFLAELEKRLGCPLRFFFDEIIGTSTGGILALGLSAGYFAQELVDIYVDNGKKIFKSSLFRQGLTRARYDHRGIESLLKTKFGEKTLSEISSNVIVTSYNLNEGKP